MEVHKTIEQVTELVLQELLQAGIRIAPDPMEIPVNISGRHLHLCQRDFETLFGSGAQLTVEKPISQPGQFASRQFVTLTGPRGCIPNLRVLGSLRSESQVELAMSEARRIGLRPPVRSSGDLMGSPGVLLTGPAGSVRLELGAIVADRHIHMTPAQAALWSLTDGQRIRVRLATEKGGILDCVTVQVGENYALDMHLDADDANAFLIQENCRGTILVS